MYFVTIQAHYFQHTTCQQDKYLVSFGTLPILRYNWIAYCFGDIVAWNKSYDHIQWFSFAFEMIL